MRKFFPLLTLCVLFITFTGCNSDDKTSDMAVFAVPVFKSLAEIRNGVSITAARQTSSEGKIYVAEDYLFFIAKEEGVHIYNNTNPQSPINTAFINIEGVHDIAVRGNYLFADNYVDLLVFDISDISNITLVNTVGNVIEFLPAFPEDVAFFDYAEATEDKVVVGYTKVLKPRPQFVDDGVFTVGDGFGSNGAASGGQESVGVGGSYAKFQINGNALYTTDSYQLNVFNITNPAEAFFDKHVYMTQWFGGGQFETLFRQGDYLFIGATTGMFVVDAHDVFNPEIISGFSHATACDPVVVSGNTAYITVRGGTTCGAIEDEVTVIDITDIQNPSHLSSYLLDQPRGLGVRNGIVYVCNSDGLNVFDASGNALILENLYTDNVTDVIPLDSHLITVGPNQIKQYNYGPGYTLDLISIVNF